MPEIILATVNARYTHAAFGLRYLKANLEELEARSELLEFDLSQRPSDIVEALLASEPRIIGLGIYIWNVQISSEIVSILKRVRPAVIVILGGPEVSYETDDQSIVKLADYVITGEADLKFAEVCRYVQCRIESSYYDCLHVTCAQAFVAAVALSHAKYYKIAVEPIATI